MANGYTPRPAAQTAWQAKDNAHDGLEEAISPLSHGVM